MVLIALVAIGLAWALGYYYAESRRDKKAGNYPYGQHTS